MSKQRKQRVIKQLIGEPEMEYYAVRADSYVVTTLNNYFKDGWRIWQTFTFNSPLGLNAAAAGCTPENNAVVILEREKRG